MTPTKKLTAEERRLTAIQRAALESLDKSGPSELALVSPRTVESLLGRKLIDRIGRSRWRSNFALTDLGRSVLAYRVQHTGRAKR